LDQSLFEGQMLFWAPNKNHQSPGRWYMQSTI